MRLLTLLALTVASAQAFSFRDIGKGVASEVVDEAPLVRGSGREAAADDTIARRVLKGSKGGGNCESISVYTFQKDYKKVGSLIGDFGEALEGLPVYDKHTGRIIATITESLIDTGKDCTSSGAINFGLKKANDGRAKDQLMYQGTCAGGLTNAVTGGSGDFTGAKGVMHYAGAKKDKFYFELAACV